MTAKSLTDPTVAAQIGTTVKKQFDDLIDKNIGSIAEAMDSGISGAKLNKHTFRFEVTARIKDGKLHLDNPKTGWSIKKELCGESTTIDIDDNPELPLEESNLEDTLGEQAPE